MADAAPTLALVMTGGGARAAYQVGFLRFLARRLPDLDIPIMTGVSAGAINAAFLASHEGSFSESVTALAELWSSISPEKVVITETWSLLRTMGRWAIGLLAGGSHLAPPRRGLMDTAPLAELLHRELPNEDGVLTGIRRKLEAGRLQAFGLTTTNYGTGRSVTWVQKGARGRAWDRPHRHSREADITVEHVLASAALPLLFPAVSLGNGWHGDGGIRLTAPLSPAVHLGADKVLAISNRYQRNREEAERSVIYGYPPPAQVIGTMMNAMFLDMLDADALHMQRINSLIESAGPSRVDGLRILNTLVLRPSQDLGRLAAAFEFRLPRSIRFFTRGFGTRDTDAPDSLSFLMFQADYIRSLMALGAADAEERAEEIVSFVSGYAGPARNRET